MMKFLNMGMVGMLTFAGSSQAKKPTLHLIGIFHTIPSNEFSHCAFTGKVLRFSKMMQMQGYDVIEYANEGSESEAATKVQILSKPEFDEFIGNPGSHEFVGNNADTGLPIFAKFHSILIEKMRPLVKKFDIICHPFGHTHQELQNIFPDAFHVESGIGYPTTWAPYRVFESSAWMHYQLGKKELVNGNNYDFVAPNYYDTTEWKKSLEPSPERPIVFMGRITWSKGLAIIQDLARLLPERQFLIAGQGNFSEFFPEGKAPNVRFLGSLKGRARSDLLSMAEVALMPTQFVEPFGGSGVEAQLTGTPLITTNFGAFTETVEHGKTGFRCNTIGDFVQAIENAKHLNRTYIAERARNLYSLETVGKQYDGIFQTIADLDGEGFYTKKSHFIKPATAGAGPGVDLGSMKKDVEGGETEPEPPSNLEDAPNMPDGGDAGKINASCEAPDGPSAKIHEAALL